MMKIENDRRAMPVEVLIAYDNVAAGKHAKELCDRLQQRLGDEYELRVNAWNVAALRIPALAEMVIQETRRADLIIAAVNGEMVLPATLQSWISRCLRSTSATGGAVVAQLHAILRMGRELAPADDELKRIPRQVHGGFLPPVAEPAENELASFLDEIHQRSRMSTAALEAILKPNPNG